MKKQVRIIYVLMFLFMYFLIPKSVFAAKGAVTCVCTGDVNLEINFVHNEGTSDQIENILWGDQYGQLTSCDDDKLKVCPIGSGDCPNEEKKCVNKAPDGFPQTMGGSVSNGGKFTLSSGAPNSSALNCPAAVVVESISDGKSGKIFLYDKSYMKEAEAWADDINKTKKENGSKFGIKAWESKAKAAYLTCSHKTGERTNPDTGEKVADANGVVSNNSSTDILKQSVNRDTPYKVKWLKALKNANFLISRSVKLECSDVFGNVNDEASLASFLQKIFNYIRIFGILLVLVMSAVEFAKVILSSDYEALGTARKKLTFRMGCVVALLLLPFIINFLMGLFISGTIVDFSCGIK